MLRHVRSLFRAEDGSKYIGSWPTIEEVAVARGTVYSKKAVGRKWWLIFAQLGQQDYRATGVEENAVQIGLYFRRSDLRTKTITCQKSNSICHVIFCMRAKLPHAKWFEFVDLFFL